MYGHLRPKAIKKRERWVLSWWPSTPTHNTWGRPILPQAHSPLLSQWIDSGLIPLYFSRFLFCCRTQEGAQQSRAREDRGGAACINNELKHNTRARYKAGIQSLMTRQARCILSTNLPLLSALLKPAVTHSESAPLRPPPPYTHHLRLPSRPHARTARPYKTSSHLTTWLIRPSHHTTTQGPQSRA